ncbi:MAG: hypothetical protein ABEJ79_11115 [Halolamina sp.]
MFERRDLANDVEAVKTAHAPEALVLDADADFRTLPPETAEELGLLVDSLSPATFPESWLPKEAPAALEQYASDAFTVGMPGDGTVAWTTQTDPPVVICKGRAEGVSESFLDFLLAEALVEVGLELPEQFLPFFGERYPDLAAATSLSPSGDYQLAAALSTGWRGLVTREVFADWDGEHDRLYEAWVDAGDRVEPRLSELPSELARGETGFPAAAELSCSAVKHAIEPPTPFAALDTAAYRDHGADYAVRWAEKTFAELDDA